MTTPPTPDAGEPEVIVGIRAAVFAEAALPARIEQYKEILAAYDTLTAQLAAANADGAILARVQDNLDIMNRSGELSDAAFDKFYEVIPHERYMQWLTPKLDAARTGAR